MRSAVVALALLAAPVACDRWEPGDHTTGRGGGNLPPVQTDADRDAGAPDADAETVCDPDVDGTAAATPALVVSELAFGGDGFIELYFRGPGELSLGSVSLTGTATASALGSARTGEGFRVVLAAPNLPTSGELAVAIDGSVVSYVCWGQILSELQTQVSAAQIWLSPGACALPPSPGRSLHLQGRGVFAADWIEATPTPSSCTRSRD